MQSLFTYRFSIRSTGVLTIVALMVAIAPAWAGDSDETADRLAPLRFLAGSCWRGQLPGGDQTDTHCYRAMYGTAFLRDTHRVSADADGNEYAGETVYAWQPDRERIGYRYFNSLGGVSDGDLVIAGNGRSLEFPGERYVGPDGEKIELRSVLTRLADNRYVTVTEQRGKDGWQEVRRVEFERIAAATDAGPAARQQADKLEALARLVGGWGKPDEVASAREERRTPEAQFAYRWGPRRMLLRSFEGPGSSVRPGAAPDPVLEGMVFWDHLAGTYAFTASSRYGWTFHGHYRVIDANTIERVYDVHYAQDEEYIPEPDLGGQVRRFRETFVFKGDDRLDIRLDIFKDEKWQPFGPGTYAAVRIDR